MLRFRPLATDDNPVTLRQTAYWCGFGILAAAGLILAIRLAYWLVRRKEGMGLGDAKLMAMLAAWLGLPAALESFALAILGATVAALIWLAIRARRRDKGSWGSLPLPLGTFLSLAALTQIFAPSWLWNWWQHYLLLPT
jgi:leader peptidase (prepilin peptidase)/N-methyltransferase